MPPEFVSLTCPTCGSKLQVGRSFEQFACGYCGNEMIVKRSGGIVALEPVLASLDRIETGVRAVEQSVSVLRPGVDNTASELAIQRLDKELAGLQYQLSTIEPVGMTGASILAIVGVVGTIIGFNNLPSSGPSGLLVFGFVLALGVIWSWRAQKNANARRAPIQQAIERAYREREKHMNILRPKGR